MAKKPLLPRPFQAAPPARPRVGDHVFQALSRSILEGELKAGEALAGQRELAAQFDVSPVVVRQAIHRLEELGLVRVKQGSTTIVLDPAEASDLRVLELQIELAEPSPRHRAWLLEVQTLSALGLLTLAESRIRREEVARLVELTAQADGSSPQALRSFRFEYWNCIAKATRNPLLQHSIRFWTTTLSKLEQTGSMHGTKDPLFPGLYQQLNRTLAEGRGSVEFYLNVIRKIHQMTAMMDAPSTSDSTKSSKSKRRPPESD